MPADEQPKAPWYRTSAARFFAAVALPSLLAVLCPLLPPAAQGVCRVGGQVLTQGARQLTNEQPLQQPSSSSDGACAPGTPPRSVPQFCKCVDGRWVDYWDAGFCQLE